MAKVEIQITGSLIACSQGVRDDWRDLAEWLRSKMAALYGDQVAVKYYDIFDPACPILLPDAKLPVVRVNEEVLSMGGKISMTLIRKKIESLGILTNQE
jgi:disulfide oxidoreductase YuzD